VKKRPQRQNYAETEVLPGNLEGAGDESGAIAGSRRRGPKAAVRRSGTDDPPDPHLGHALALTQRTHTAPGGFFDHALYDEYVCELDKIPVLRDPVELPRARLQADFRQGQRPDARRESRSDAYTRREAQAGDLLSLYVEHSQAAATPPKRAKRKKPAKRTKRPRSKKQR
jgi:hypothetical protein